MGPLVGEAVECRRNNRAGVELVVTEIVFYRELKGVQV
jgi:hypothetical protein